MNLEVNLDGSTSSLNPIFPFLEVHYSEGLEYKILMDTVTSFLSYVRLDILHIIYLNSYH